MWRTGTPPDDAHVDLRVPSALLDDEAGVFDSGVGRLVDEDANGMQLWRVPGEAVRRMWIRGHRSLRLPARALSPYAAHAAMPETDYRGQTRAYLDGMARALTERGWEAFADARPIVLEVCDGRASIIDGNHRLRVALDAGRDDVPVRVMIFESSQYVRLMGREINDELAELLA